MPKKNRLDIALVDKKLVATRSQAENLIKLGYVKVNKVVVTKPGYFIPTDDAVVTLHIDELYVSRAALKLASVAEQFKLNFKDRVVLDVGSSTGGFTDFALKRGAKKVIAVEVGSNQLHPSLLGNERIELHEQTDIRHIDKLSSPVDVVVIDVSFVSVRELLPHIAELVGRQTQIIVMLKPQFEAQSTHKHKGVIKNERMRRSIIHEFEDWLKLRFVVENKADSQVAGAKGNVERFYLIRKL